MYDNLSGYHIVQQATQVCVVRSSSTQSVLGATVGWIRTSCLLYSFDCHKYVSNLDMFHLIATLPFGLAMYFLNQPGWIRQYMAVSSTNQIEEVVKPNGYVAIEQCNRSLVSQISHSWVLLHSTCAKHHLWLLCHFYTSSPPGSVISMLPKCTVSRKALIDTLVKYV